MDISRRDCFRAVAACCAVPLGMELPQESLAAFARVGFLMKTSVRWGSTNTVSVWVSMKRGTKEDGKRIMRDLSPNSRYQTCTYIACTEQSLGNGTFSFSAEFGGPL